MIRLIFAALMLAVLLYSGAFGVNSYLARQRRIERENRIAQEIAEQQRQNEERIAKEKEDEARRVRDESEQELSRLERKLNESEAYLTDELSAEAAAAKYIASSVMRDANKISDIGGEFSGRIDALKSRALTITSRADEIIRSAEEDRKRQAEEEDRKRKEQEEQRAKRITDSIIARLEKRIPGITKFQLESADNVLPPSGNEIDTPLGKMKVCSAEGDYAFLDAEALIKILKSFCGDKFVSNIPDKSFGFQCSRTEAEWYDRLNTIESEIFLNVDDIKPAHIINPLNLEKYIASAISSSKQHNFRLFFRGEDGKYIIVFVSSSGTLDIYIGSTGNVLPVMKRDFLRALKYSVEINEHRVGINERRKEITFYLKHKDEKLAALDTDGKFELWINQLTDTGGSK